MQQKHPRASRQNIFHGARHFVAHLPNYLGFLMRQRLVQARRKTRIFAQSTPNLSGIGALNAPVIFGDDFGLIHYILRHFAVSRPFAAGDGEQSRFGNHNRVIA